MTTVYLAGGMQAAWQDAVITGCPGITFVDPRTHGLTDEREYTAWDLAGIRSSDLVFAYMSTDNPSGYGLSLEVGYAYAIGKPVWYVCEDTLPRQRSFGMVRSCAAQVFTDLQTAVAALARFAQAL